MINEPINGTGISEFQSGQKISPIDTFNALNRTVNETVSASNSYLKNFININEELQDYQRNFSNLSEAISLVPEKRRYPGLEIKYLSSRGYESFIYSGSGPEDFLDTENWQDMRGPRIIDGGEF